jgi:hypothetical protein
MKNMVRYGIILGLSVVGSCTVMMDDNPARPSDDDHSSSQQPLNQPVGRQISRTIAGFFPFEDNSNKWNYSESGGNTVTILVTDTISDDGVTYFRVSFRENRVDTTDDWFLRSKTGVCFGQSLTGKYDLFIPTKVDSISGCFESAGSTVTYGYYDSLSINGIKFYNAIHFQYNTPIIHGFDEITLVDSIGIVELVDHSGRWPIHYSIDSCRVGGNSKTF